MLGSNILALVLAILGLAVELTSIMVLCFSPETLHYRDPVPSGPNVSMISVGSPEQGLSQWRKLIRIAENSVYILVSDTRILMAISAFVFHMLFVNRDTLLQYISTRYDTSLSRATLLVSVRSGLVVLLCIIVVPKVGTYYRDELGSLRAGLFLSRISAALLVLGFLGVGLSSNLMVVVLSLVLNSLGWGLFTFSGSFMANLVDTHTKSGG